MKMQWQCVYKTNVQQSAMTYVGVRGEQELQQGGTQTLPALLTHLHFPSWSPKRKRSQAACYHD